MKKGARHAIQRYLFPTEDKAQRMAAPVMDRHLFLRYLDIQIACPVADAELHAFPLLREAGIDTQDI